MSKTDAPVMGKSTESAARPLLWNRPRLRFTDGAPDGSAGDPPEGDQDGGEGTPPETPDETPEGTPPADPDAGAKSALVKERVARKAAEKALTALQAELANKDKPAEEQALIAARAEGATAATTKANERIVRAEVKAAATGKVKNPALALKLIDTSGIDVNDDGEVDSDALNQAIADLLTEYPELAADGGSRFGGSGDQGAKGKPSKPAQLSETDLKSMTPEQVGAARAAGQLNTLLGVK